MPWILFFLGVLADLTTGSTSHLWYHITSLSMHVCTISGIRYNVVARRRILRVFGAVLLFTQCEFSPSHLSRCILWIYTRVKYSAIFYHIFLQYEPWTSIILFIAEIEIARYQALWLMSSDITDGCMSFLTPVLLNCLQISFYVEVLRSSYPPLSPRWLPLSPGPNSRQRNSHSSNMRVLINLPARVCSKVPANRLDLSVRFRQGFTRTDSTPSTTCHANVH